MRHPNSLSPIQFRGFDSIFLSDMSLGVRNSDFEYSSKPKENSQLERVLTNVTREFLRVTQERGKITVRDNATAISNTFRTSKSSMTGERAAPEKKKSPIERLHQRQRIRKRLRQRGYGVVHNQERAREYEIVYRLRQRFIGKSKRRMAKEVLNCPCLSNRRYPMTRGFVR